MLEWILIIELVLLIAAALFAGVGMIIAKNDSTDPIYIWCNTFWRNFLWPPLVMELDSRDTGARPTPPPEREPTGELSEEDAIYGRVKRDRDGRIVTSSLTLLIMPHSVKDEVVGVEDGALKIQVIGEAGDGRTNKGLIEIVSKAINVKPYQVTITKGHYHPRKTVQIQGLRPDELEGRLASLS
jgi:uncharacterized protein (TIGR00251 family)